MADKRISRAFLLFGTNAIFCTDAEAHTHNRVAFRPHRNNRLFGLRWTAKTWKTMTGVQRWLSDSRVIKVHQPGSGPYSLTCAQIAEMLA